jgi:hypothetical protein
MNCGWDRLPRRALLFHNAEDWEQGNPDADGAAVSSSWRGHSGNLSRNSLPQTAFAETIVRCHLDE